MSKRFLVVTSDSALDDALRIVDCSNETITTEKTGRIAPSGDSGSYQGTVGRGGDYAAMVSNNAVDGSRLHIVDLSSLTVVARAAKANTGRDAGFSPDGDRVVMLHDRADSGEATLYEFDGSSLSQLDVLSFGATSMVSMGLSPTELRGVAGVGGASYLFSYYGDTLSQDDFDGALDNDSEGGIAYSNAGDFVAVTDPSLGVSVASVAGDALALVDSDTGPLRRADWNDDDSRIYIARGIYDFDGSALTLAGNPDPTAKVLALSDDGSVFLTTTGTNLILRSTSDFSQLGSTVDLGQSISVIAAIPAQGPATDQELFQANYDQAGTEDPLVTALVSPAPTQRCIDSMAEWLRRDPKEWTLPIIVPIGQREHFIPLKQFNIRADEPGLRSGRDVVLKSVRFSSADPSEPAICTFTAPTKD